jgi:hypothetical protein
MAQAYWKNGVASCFRKRFILDRGHCDGNQYWDIYDTQAKPPRTIARVYGQVKRAVKYCEGVIDPGALDTRTWKQKQSIRCDQRPAEREREHSSEFQGITY